MTTEEQQYYMQITVDLSQYALDRKNDGPFGAIIVKNGKIVGNSCNVEFRKTNPCDHAEVIAIRDACRNLKTLDLSGCQIFSYSEPCPMCLAAIYWAQITEIYYGKTKNNVNKNPILESISNEPEKSIINRFNSVKV